jgi:hypothetical protein
VFSCEEAEIEPFISPGREKHNQSFTEHFAHQKPLPEEADTICKICYKLKTEEARKHYAKRKKHCGTSIRHYQTCK